MRSGKDPDGSRISLYGTQDFATEKLRKSLEFLEKNNQVIFFRNKSLYRRAYKPLVFQEGLNFVHKNKTPRKQRQKSQTATFAYSLKPSPLPKFSETMKIPTPVVIFNVKPRSATPVVEESEKVTQNKKLIVRPIKPKIIIKRKSRNKTAKSAETDTLNDITKDFGELDPWEMTNEVSYFSGLN
jgi:hypothetical protein